MLTGLGSMLDILPESPTAAHTTQSLYTAIPSGLEFEVGKADLLKFCSDLQILAQNYQQVSSLFVVQNIVIIIFWTKLFMAGPSIKSIVETAAPYLLVINTAQSVALSVTRK
jgi:hypothetical protein